MLVIRDRENLLIPPPPASLPGVSFHTVSEEIWPFSSSKRVPPQASVRSRRREVDMGVAVTYPVTRTIVARGDSHRNAHSGGGQESLLHLLHSLRAHTLSALPQLMETTDGRRVVSWMAVETASMKPWSVFGAKYTAMVVPGATPPSTSISSITSPSGPLGSPGWFWALRTLTASTVGVGDPESTEIGGQVQFLEPAARSIIAAH